MLKSLCFSSFYCKTRKIRPFSNMTITKKATLYGDEASPPVRFVLMTAALLDVDLDFYKIDLFKGENKSESYKKINPLQKVPALCIDNDVICDSHAIATYLCSKKDEQNLYLTDAIIRAKVDQMLYFNATILFYIDGAILSEYFSGKWPADEKKVSQWYSAIDYLELQLSKSKWLVGDKMQLCDICCASTLSSLGLLLPPKQEHIHVKKWMKQLNNMPCFNINRRGVERLRFFIKTYGPSS